MSPWVDIRIIVIVLVVVGLIVGAFEVSPLRADLKRWVWMLVLLGAAGYLAWKLLG